MELDIQYSDIFPSVLRVSQLEYMKSKSKLI